MAAFEFLKTRRDVQVHRLGCWDGARLMGDAPGGRAREGPGVFCQPLRCGRSALKRQSIRARNEMAANGYAAADDDQIVAC